MAPNDSNITPNQDIPNADTPATEPVSDAPVLDMDAINEAVAATANEGNKIQNTFDVDDISLDNTPTSDAELKQQMDKNPDLNLAGGATSEEPAAPADYVNHSDPIDNPASAPESKPESKPAETAGFVDGDIANESEGGSDDHSDEPPVVAANVVTAPGAKKSNKPLFMILGGVGALAVIVILIIVIMSLYNIFCVISQTLAFLGVIMFFMKETYITTAIPYVNGNPHLGHAMDYLLADVLRRYMMMCGKTVRLQAGTDEHGSKIFKKAAEQGIPTQEFVDQNATKFQDFIHSLGVEYTDFVRTTDPDHESRCQKIWTNLSDHIYKDKYEGWYCEGCEGYVTDKEHDENDGICPDHKKPYMKLSEENYYLRIADFKDQIRKAIESDELKITPVFRKKEFLNLLKDMPDVSISRPKEQVEWGVPVPGDESQVMYVWIDALANYITILGYPDKDISDTWPAHTQIVGKDILRFHAGIWPAMLLGLGLPFPKNLLAHGFITVNGEKMSKSIGNVVDPVEILAKHGLTPFRYYFLRHASTTEDSDFTWDKYEASYNELANDLGNLVQRLATLCKKNEVAGLTRTNRELDGFDAFMESYEFNKAFDLVWAEVQNLNKRIDEEKPWALAKTEPEKAKAILAELSTDLLGLCDKMGLFIPETADKIAAIFTAAQIVPPAEPLFPKA